MKFVVFGDSHRLGLLDGQRILDLARAVSAESADSQTLSSLPALIEAGDRGLDLVRKVIEEARRAGEPAWYCELSKVKLQAPFPGQRLAMAGANNAHHVADCFTNMGTPRTAEEIHAATRNGAPSAFWAVARPVMGPGAKIEIPARAAGLFDYEGEPAVVLGKRGKDIKAKDFKSYAWGVTQVIDWSVREEAWPPRPANPVMLIKNFDCSKSIGPCIAVDEVDIDDFQLQTIVNGTLRQDHNTRDMIFSFAEVLEYLSQDLTFVPGDVLTGGTGAGTAVDKTIPNKDGSWPRDLFLKAGDTVELKSQIGSLIGHVVPKSASAA